MVPLRYDEVAGADVVLSSGMRPLRDMAAALRCAKDYLKAVAGKGWNFRQYKPDHSADKAGSVVLSVVEVIKPPA